MSAQRYHQKMVDDYYSIIKHGTVRAVSHRLSALAPVRPPRPLSKRAAREALASPATLPAPPLQSFDEVRKNLDNGTITTPDQFIAEISARPRRRRAAITRGRALMPAGAL